MPADAGTPMTPAESVKLIKDAIETADQALDLYNKVLDQIIPWGTFEETIARIAQYRDDYSIEAAMLVGKVTTLLGNSQDSYFEAVDKVYQWCDVAVVVLPAYVNALSDPDTASKQKDLLLKVLQVGAQDINAGVTKLEEASRSFNDADGELTVLYKRLDEDFDQQSGYFKQQVDKIRKEAYGGAAVGVVGGPFGLIVAYAIAAGVVEGQLVPELMTRLESVKAFFKKLQDEITATQSEIGGAKVELRNEAVALGELKSEIETTAIFIELDAAAEFKAEITTAAMTLAESCQGYRSRHQAKPNPMSLQLVDAQQLIQRMLATRSVAPPA